MKNLIVAVFVLQVSAVAFAADSVERRLHPASLEASSFLWNDWNKFQENYHPNYVGDGDPKTAWVEGVKGKGEGEWLRMRVTPVEGATEIRLRFRNGYQKSKGLYKANARPKSVTIKLLPSGKEKTVTLKDTWGWQEARVPQPSGKLEGFEMELKSVYPGTRYEDTCLSDLELFVTATTPDNPAFEKSRYERLIKWKKDRLAAAKLFKQSQSKELPIGTSYRFTSDGRRPHDKFECDWRDEACKMRQGLEGLASRLSEATSPEVTLAQELLADIDSKLRPMQVVPKDKRPIPTVDGLRTLEIYEEEIGGYMQGLVLPPQLGYLRRDTLGTFEVTGTPSFAEVMHTKPRACKRSRDAYKTYAYVYTKKSAEGREQAKAILLAYCGMADGREGYYPIHQAQLLVYNDEGNLSVLVSGFDAAQIKWDTSGNRSVLATAEKHYLYSGEASGALKLAQPVASR